MPQRDQIQIRDPFIVPVQEEGQYYLFGTTDANAWSGRGGGFDYYTSRDLELWDGPFPAFRPEAGFWGTTNFWAPEVHQFQDRWYLFASFKDEGVCRGTQVLVSDKVGGPYRAQVNRAQTPAEWECLDGTLFVDDSGNPWMVFCHEWVQVKDGEICALPLSQDLQSAVGEPSLLFRASQAPWVSPHAPGNYVTDGPFLHRSQDGSLLMIWSSFKDGAYALGVARSVHGGILGPWVQEAEPLFAGDGGHGMIFRTFEGQLMLSLHQPNQTPFERSIFIPIVDAGGKILAP